MKLTHPDRIYWSDVGVTKQQLADYYTAVWDHIAPHLVRRPLALLRCPEGVDGQCFFQKHAAAGLISERIRRHKDSHGEELIYIEDLDGLLTLAQAGVLEIHVWGSTIDDVEHCNRLVFDLDPGDDVKWADVNATARELRERLADIKLKSFVKTTGGKGLHVVVPIDPTPWDDAKDFSHAMVLAMAADAPDRYVAKMTKSIRKGKIFLDYLRNGRGATAIVAYSTRGAAGRDGLDAGRVGRARPEARAEQVHRAQHRQAARAAEERPVGRDRQGAGRSCRISRASNRSTTRRNRPLIGWRARLH